MVEIEFRGVYKIFGEDAGKLFRRLKIVKKLKKLNKSELLGSTAHTLALDNIHLQVEKGEFFVLMGLSGSGKSTLIRHINRLIDPTSGEILINGENILQFPIPKLLKFRQQQFSMVFQHFGLLPHWNVVKNVTLGLKIQGMSSVEAQKRALPVLEKVGLINYAGAYPDELSGGMKQRVGLARALCSDNPILLMDEPFSGLDPIIRYDMQNLLLAWKKDLKKTIFFITHDLEEAFRLSDRMAILHEGQIQQCGTAEEILKHPKNALVEAFIAPKTGKKPENALFFL